MDSKTNSADYAHLHIWLWVNDPQVHVSHFHKDQLKKQDLMTDQTESQKLEEVSLCGSHGGIMSPSITGNSCLGSFISYSQN